MQVMLEYDRAEQYRAICILRHQQWGDIRIAHVLGLSVDEVMRLRSDPPRGFGFRTDET